MRIYLVVVFAFLSCSALGVPTRGASDHDEEQHKLSLLVIDFSGWRSQGLSDRVTNAVSELRPEATVISVGIKESLPVQHPTYDIILSVRDPDVQALRQLILERVERAAASSKQVLVHIDINEEALPQQLREVFGVQLLGTNETRGPGRLGASLIEACGANFAETVVLRGHSDGTCSVRYMLQALHKVGIAPSLVVLESPREKWDVWKSRFQEFPQTFFVGVTAELDLPRDGVADFGFGRAEEVPTKNYANVHLEKWDSDRVNPHSAPTAYGETVRQLRIRGRVGDELTDFRVNAVKLGEIVRAIGSRPKNFDEFVQRLAGGQQKRVVWLDGFPQTGGQKARQIAQAGLVAVLTLAGDPAPASDVPLVIREAGDHELSRLGNRGELPEGRFSPADPALTKTAQVFIGDRVLECLSGKDMALAVAAFLVQTERQRGIPPAVPMWSTTHDFAGPDTALMTDFARQRLDRPGFETQPVLVVGDDKKANLMALNLTALGVEVIRLRMDLSPTEAETWGRQTGAAAVLRVGQPPLLAVHVAAGALLVPESEGRRTVDGYVIEQVSGTRWSQVRKEDDPPSDSVWVYDGRAKSSPEVADAVDQKAKELGLPTGPNNKTKVVVGGDPRDPKFVATVEALRNKGYDVIEEHWTEGSLSEDQKKARVAKRAGEVGAKLGVVDGYTILESDDDRDGAMIVTLRFAVIASSHSFRPKSEAPNEIRRIARPCAVLAFRKVTIMARDGAMIVTLRFAVIASSHSFRPKSEAPNEIRRIARPCAVLAFRKVTIMAPRRQR